MLTVGVRELKNRLTHYIRLTKGGKRVIVTDHGNPVAVLHEISKVEKNAPPEELLAASSGEGVIRLPLAGAELDLKSKPSSHKGRAASEILLKDRR